MASPTAPRGEQNYTKRVSKSLKRVALRSALSDRARTGDVRVISDLTFDDAAHQGRAWRSSAALELGDRRVLWSSTARDESVRRSFRNLADVHVLTVDQLNTYDVLVSDVVVFQQARSTTSARAPATTSSQAKEPSNKRTRPAVRSPARPAQDRAQGP